MNHNFIFRKSIYEFHNTLKDLGCYLKSKGFKPDWGRRIFSGCEIREPNHPFKTCYPNLRMEAYWRDIIEDFSTISTYSSSERIFLRHNSLFSASFLSDFCWSCFLNLFNYCPLGFPFLLHLYSVTYQPFLMFIRSLSSLFCNLNNVELDIHNSIIRNLKIK